MNTDKYRIKWITVLSIKQIGKKGTGTAEHRAKKLQLFHKLDLEISHHNNLRAADILQIAAHSLQSCESCAEEELVQTFIQKLLMMNYRARYLSVEEVNEQDHMQQRKVTHLKMRVIFSMKCLSLTKEQVNLSKSTQWMFRWPCFIVLMVSWSSWWWLNCPCVSTLCLCLFLIHSHNRLSFLSGHSDKSTRAGRWETKTMKSSVKHSQSTRQKLQWCFSSGLALGLHPSLSWWTVWSMRVTTHSSTGNCQAAAEPESWWMSGGDPPGSAPLRKTRINSLSVLLSVIYTVMQENMRNSCRSSLKCLSQCCSSTTTSEVWQKCINAPKAVQGLKTTHCLIAEDISTIKKRKLNTKLV